MALTRSRIRTVLGAVVRLCAVVVTPLLARTILASRARLEVDTAARATFFNNGEPLRGSFWCSHAAA